MFWFFFYNESDSTRTGKYQNEIMEINLNKKHDQEESYQLFNYYTTSYLNYLWETNWCSYNNNIKIPPPPQPCIINSAPFHKI